MNEASKRMCIHLCMGALVRALLLPSLDNSESYVLIESERGLLAAVPEYLLEPRPILSLLSSCVNIHTYMHACIHTHTHTHTRTHTRHNFEHTQAHPQACIYTQTDEVKECWYMYKHCIYRYTCIHECLCAYVHVCMCTYIHIHIHT